MAEGRRGQLLLFLEVIGNAGRVEAYLARDFGKSHAFYTVDINQRRSSIQDIDSFLFEFPSGFFDRFQRFPRELSLFNLAVIIHQVIIQFRFRG